MIYTRTRVLRVRRAQNYRFGKLPRRTNIINPLFVVSLVVATFMIGSLAGVHLTNRSQPDQVLAATSEPVLVPSAPSYIKPEVKTESSQPAYTIDPEMQKYIETWVKNNSTNGKNWSVYVQGLKTDSRLAMYNSNQQFKIASLYKLFLVRPLSLRLAPSKWPSQKTKDGRTYQQCVTDMIQTSDNICAQNITNYIGYRKIDNQLKADSYLNTTFAKNENVTGTARDTAALLERIYTSKEYDAYTRSLVLSAMKNQKYRDGIPTVCNTSCVAYNKTGDFHGYLNDAAIIESPKSSYMIVIISNGGKWNQISALANGIHDHMSL